MAEAAPALDPLPQVRRAVHALAVLGLRPGDRLLTLLPNEPATFALGLACSLQGVIQVPLPTDLRPPEAVTIAEDADPAHVLLGATVVPETGAALGRRWPTRGFSAATLAALQERDARGAWPVTRPMAYTSGTTGRRKGVWVGVQDEEWGRAVTLDERDAFDARHGDTHLVVSPLYHSGPFRFAVTTALGGGRVAVLQHFDVEALLATLREVRPTSLFCVPTHLHRLLAHPGLRADDLASLTLLAHAGAPCPVRLKERVLDLAPDGSVWEFYGSTEGQFTVCPPHQWTASPGGVGRARRGRTLEVRGADGATAAPGVIGTVWVRGPAFTRWAYWGDDDRTAASWDGEAFTVGDLGSLDPTGVLTLHGRPGDLVISGGVNVYPAEVERALLDIDGVAEAVAFGVDDDAWGQRLVAAVVPHDGSALDGTRLRATLRDVLGGARVPKQVLVVDDLPRTATGKVRRAGLAEAFDLDDDDGQELA